MCGTGRPGRRPRPRTVGIPE